VPRSAVVVIVPEAVADVSRHQSVNTPAGAAGMPPHVTLFVPFTDGEEAVEPARVASLGELLAGFAPFPFRLTRTARFRAASVLYLTPEPAEPFVHLALAVIRRFPEHAPYGGLHPDPVPHLTVAKGDEALLGPIEADVRRSLPIAAVASEAALVVEREGRWTVEAALPFLSASAP
jgi:2'-5' RNA ligase